MKLEIFDEDNLKFVTIQNGKLTYIWFNSIDNTSYDFSSSLKTYVNSISIFTRLN